MDRDLLRAAPLVLPVAQRRVERDAGVAQVADGVRERLLDRRVRDVQPVRRVHGVGEVELRREEAGRAGDRHRAERAGREAAEQDRAAGVEVVVQVPCAQHRTCLADVDRAARARHDGRCLAEVRKLVAPQLAGVLAVVEHDVLELAARELVAGPAVGAGQPLLRHHEARPLAQRALGALVADDPVESLERLVGVRDPVAVVGVQDVVVPAQLRQVRRAEDARLDRVRVAAPLARRQRAVEHRQPERRDRSRVPSTVLQVVAFSFVTCGTTEMSAYSALPSESAAIVLTHGTPWLRTMTSSSSSTLCAWFTSKKWFR